MACVYIPVQNSEEEVRVALDQLPRDASDILDILKAEQAPLDLWLVIAVTCFSFPVGIPLVLHWLLPVRAVRSGGMFSFGFTVLVFRIFAVFHVLLSSVCPFSFASLFANLVLMQREYFKQGKIDQFRQILEEGSSPGIFCTPCIPS